MRENETVKKRGIDVSEWQHTIDWERAADDGVEFAMIRASHGLREDESFRKNIEGALDAGISVGVYHCAYASEAENFAAEVSFFLETIRPYREEITYPVAIDMEQNAQYRQGKSAVTALILSFADRATQNGYIPMCYTNCNWLNSVIDKSALAEAGVDVWVSWPRGSRRLEDLPEDGVTKHAHTMWQFSASGSVAGIGTDVDLDVSYADYDNSREDPYPEPDSRYMTLEQVGDLLAELGCEGILL